MMPIEADTPENTSSNSKLTRWAKRNWWLRSWKSATAGIAIGALFAGALGWSPPDNRLEASEMLIKDGDGNTVIHLFVKDGCPVLELSTHRTQSRIQLEIAPSGQPQVSVVGKDGVSRLSYVIDDSGASTLDMVNPDSEGRLQVRCSSGSSYVMLRGARKEHALIIETTSDGSPYIRLSDEASSAKIELGADNSTVSSHLVLSTKLNQAPESAAARLHLLVIPDEEHPVLQLRLGSRANAWTSDK